MYCWNGVRPCSGQRPREDAGADLGRVEDVLAIAGEPGVGLGRRETARFGRRRDVERRVELDAQGLEADRVLVDVDLRIGDVGLGRRLLVEETGDRRVGEPLLGRRPLERVVARLGQLLALLDRLGSMSVRSRRVGRTSSRRSSRSRAERTVDSRTTESRPPVGARVRGALASTNASCGADSAGARTRPSTVSECAVEPSFSLSAMLDAMGASGRSQRSVWASDDVRGRARRDRRCTRRQSARTGQTKVLD